MRCTSSRRGQERVFGHRPTSRWKRWLGYGLGVLTLLCIGIWILRDTTPGQFAKPSPEDHRKPAGLLVDEGKLGDVYWRVAVRHVNRVLEGVCEHNNYTVLTHKNVVMDSHLMQESYIYLCSEAAATRSVVNARAVISGASSETAYCVETYAGQRKVVPRNYPFSLKYISAETFVPQTRVVREAKEACVWLHALDIVASTWEGSI